MKAVGWTKEDGSVHWLGDRMPGKDTTLFIEVPEPPEDREPIGYELQPIYAPRRGTVATAAFIFYSSCGGAVSSSGGPRYNSLCLRCIDKLAVFNKLSK